MASARSRKSLPAEEILAGTWRYAQTYAREY
jgi:hypothetical protein